MFQQPYLQVDTPCISRQAAVGAYDPVTRDDDGYGIMAYSAAHSLGRHGVLALHGGYLPGYLAVCSHFPVWDITQYLPHLLPELTAYGRHRQR